MFHWVTAYQADGFPLFVETAKDADRPYYRVRVGDEKAGAVAVAVNDDGHILFVTQYRPALDKTLWELPRGMRDDVDADYVDTAARELAEETGLTGIDGEFLGTTYPDSGMLASEVGVVLFRVRNTDCTPTRMEEADGEVDETRWLSPADIRHMIAAGRICDAMSLAALVIANATCA